jgi:hypothetical protein
VFVAVSRFTLVVIFAGIFRELHDYTIRIGTYVKNIRLRCKWKNTLACNDKVFYSTSLGTLTMKHFAIVISYVTE